jgi:hypothetical protein
MYNKSDVKEAKAKLHVLLDEKDKFIERSETIPQSLWDNIETAYDQAVYIQKRYCLALEDYTVSRKY